MSTLDELDQLCRRRGWRLGLELEVGAERAMLSRLVVKRRRGGDVVASAGLGLGGHRKVDRAAARLLAELNGKGGAS